MHVICGIYYSLKKIANIGHNIDITNVFSMHLPLYCLL